MGFMKNYRFWTILFGTVLVSAMVGCAPVPPQAESSVPTTADATTTTTTTTVTTTNTAIPSKNEDFSFSATVIEVGEDYLMVQADADGPVYGEVCVVLQQAASVTAGDRIRVWHTGQMMPSLPPRIVATEIEMIS